MQHTFDKYQTAKANNLHSHLRYPFLTKVLSPSPEEHMDQLKRLTKEQVRKWIDERARQRKPLPSQSELRRQLNVGMSDADRNNPDAK